MLKRSLALILLGEILVSFIDASCVQNNRTYDEGETWHPILHPFGVWRCANCSCIDGEIKCVNKQCPTPTCSLPKLPRGACCPICEVDTDGSGEAGNSGRGCVYEGKHYANGDVFSSNSTGISPNMESQCVNCVCSAGQVLCKLKTCDIPRNCRQIVRTKDSCCPKCAENSKALLGASELLYSRNLKDHALHGTRMDHKSLFYRAGICFVALFYLVQAENRAISFNIDCQTVGEFHQNGTDWRPTIGKNCVKCTCLHGQVDCNRVDCATERIYCSAEKYARGECCNRCMRNSKIAKQNRLRQKICKSRKKKKRRKGRRKNGKKRRKNKKGRKKSRRRNRKNRRNQTTPSSAIKSPTPSVGTIQQTTLPSIFKSTPANSLPVEYFKRLCKPDSTDKVIYRHFKKHHGIYIAFDDLVSSQIEVLWWNVTRGKLSPMQRYKYPADNFRQYITEDVIIGAASNSEIKTFKRRLKRQMDICLRKNKCRSKIIKRAFFCFEMKKVTPNCDDSTS